MACPFQDFFRKKGGGGVQIFWVCALILTNTVKGLPHFCCSYAVYNAYCLERTLFKSGSTLLAPICTLLFYLEQRNGWTGGLKVLRVTLGAGLSRV